MKIRRFGALGAVVAASALVLSACSTPEASEDVDTSPTATESESGDEITDTSVVTVGWNQPFYSYNQNSDTGNATANSIITYMTKSKFNYYDADLNLVQDTSFGTYEVVSDDPLTITYTVNEGVVWSDGVPVDAGDLLLEWAALSGHYNSGVEPEYDSETGDIINEEELAAGTFFNSPAAGLALVTQIPEIGEDGRSITLVYDAPFADWELEFNEITLPAHVVAQRGLGIEDPTEAEAALVELLQSEDVAGLSAVASSWFTDFDYASLPSEPGLYLANGPYVISEFVENQYLTVEKNDTYTGGLVGNVDAITVRWNEDPQAMVQMLENGEIDMMAPQATADTLAALEAIDGVTVESGVDLTYEHVDLIFNNGGPFDPATYGDDAATALAVRKAFLLTIPRQAIVDQLIVPLQPDAAVRQSFILIPEAPAYPEMIATNGSDAYPLEADIAQAQALLAEAGVSTPVDVRLLFGASNVRRQNEYALIQESAAQAGFNVINASSDDWGSMLSTAQDQYDASLFGWQSEGLGVTESDANFRTGGLNNFGGYSNAEVDALFDRLQTETDPDEQVAIQIQVEQHLWADAFGTVIFQFPGVNAWNDTVTGVEPIGLNPTIFHGFWNWEKVSG